MSTIASIGICISDSHQMLLINTYARVLIGEISGVSISVTDAKNGLCVMGENQMREARQIPHLVNRS